jgi:hypothetical protein
MRVFSLSLSFCLSLCISRSLSLSHCLSLPIFCLSLTHVIGISLFRVLANILQFVSHGMEDDDIHVRHAAYIVLGQLANHCQVVIME